MIDGGGVIDGGGQRWWELQAAKQAGTTAAAAFLSKDRCLYKGILAPSTIAIPQNSTDDNLGKVDAMTSGTEHQH